ncbi:prephenate dehydratase, partial [Corynebacterium heidelbergense]
AAAGAAGEVDAAAAPARAGEIHGLEPLATGVADVKGANTRFVLVGNAQASSERTGQDRTAIVFTLPNRPAALWTALSELAVRSVDMSRIESRPTRTGMGAYVFHMELIGHIEDEAVAEALAGLHRRTERLTFLGSWPQETPVGNPPPPYSDSRGWVRGLMPGSFEDANNHAREQR